MGKPKVIQASDPNLIMISEVESFPSLLRGLLLAMKVENLKQLCDLLTACGGDFTAITIGGYNPIDKKTSRLMEAYIKDHRASAAWYAENFDWEEIPDDPTTVEVDEEDLVSIPKVGEVAAGLWNGFLNIEIVPKRVLARRPRKVVKQ